MRTATVDSQGRLTLPDVVLADLGLTVGSTVTFRRNAEGDYVLSTRSHHAGHLSGVLKRPGDPVTLEQMDEGIAAATGESNAPSG